jgi:hypothetical protein
LIVVALVFGAISSQIFKGKGRSAGSGFALGFLLGLIGLIIALFLSDKNDEAEMATPQQRSIHRECPSCKESMRRDASVCPHCRNESAPWQWDTRHWWVESSSGRYWLDEDSGQWVKYEAPRTLNDIDAPREAAATTTGTTTQIGVS